MRHYYRVFELRKETKIFSDGILLQRTHFDFFEMDNPEECEKLIEQHGMPYTDYVILKIYRKED